MYLGQLMVNMRRHAATMVDLSDEHAQAVGLIITRLGRALVAMEDADKLHILSYGEVFPHVHIYLTARYRGTPEAYWRGRITKWPGAPRSSPQEVAALCDRLRAHLAARA